MAIFVFIPPGRRPVGSRADVSRPGCLLVWQFPNGDWCWLDELWRWQWRHKVGGVIAPWWNGVI